MFKIVSTINLFGPIFPKLYKGHRCGRQPNMIQATWITPNVRCYLLCFQMKVINTVSMYEEPQQIDKKTPLFRERAN